MPEISVFPDRALADAWRVEDNDADGDGSCAITIFIGFQAEQRAREFADWLWSRQDVEVLKTAAQP